MRDNAPPKLVEVFSLIRVAMQHNHFKLLAGPAITLLAAASYGVNTTLSKLAYETGTDPLSLAVFRYWMVGIALIVLMRLKSKSWRINVKLRYLVGTVVGSYLITLGHLGAVKYIPVGLSGILFYTFPFIIIACNVVFFGQRLTPFRFGAFILAFIGLFIALGPNFNELDWRGVALALMGAVGSALFLMCYERFPKENDTYTSTSYVILICAGLGSISLVFGVELNPPLMNIGWIYLILIALFSLLAFLLTLVALRIIGATSVSMYFNFEPVVIVLMAWIFLGEVLNDHALFGVTLVIVALVLSGLGGGPSVENNRAEQANN